MRVTRFVFLLFLFRQRRRDHSGELMTADARSAAISMAASLKALIDEREALTGELARLECGVRELLRLPAVDPNPCERHPLEIARTLNRLITESGATEVGGPSAAAVGSEVEEFYFAGCRLDRGSLRVIAAPARSPLLPGDVLEEVEGDPIHGLTSLLQLISSMAPSRGSLVVGVTRDRAPLLVTVAIPPHPRRHQPLSPLHKPLYPLHMMDPVKPDQQGGDCGTTGSSSYAALLHPYLSKSTPNLVEALFVPAHYAAVAPAAATTPAANL